MTGNPSNLTPDSTHLSPPVHIIIFLSKTLLHLGGSQCSFPCYHIDIFFPPDTQSHLFSLHIGRHQFRRKIHQPAADAVQGYRVAGYQYNAHMDRCSRCRAISLHRIDTVHNIKTRPDITIQINQHPGKAFYAPLPCGAPEYSRTYF